MNAITAIKPAAARANAFAFKGRGKELRTAALAGVASLAYVEAKSRTDVVTQLRLALGKAPSVEEIAACQLEYIVGRVAQRLADTDFPSPSCTIAERLAHARALITSYAAPLKDGVKANKLRKGQAGRRTVTQHKAIRAAEETWSLLKAEIGIGAARTQAEKNGKQAAKRAPAMAGSTARGTAGKAGTGVTHTELVKADGPMTAEAACEYLQNMAATMLAFSNKHAAVIPTDYGTSVKAFKRSIDDATKARKIAAK